MVSSQKAVGTWLYIDLSVPMISRTIAACLLLAIAIRAEVKLPRLFTDGAVLQRDIPVRVWGSADPGEKVTVKFRTQTRETTADNLGRWETHLAPEKAGGPVEENLLSTQRPTFASLGTVTLARLQWL